MPTERGRISASDTLPGHHRRAPRDLCWGEGEPITRAYKTQVTTEDRNLADEPPKSPLTRGLHLLLLLAVLHQLVISNFMSRPDSGKPENLAFELHEYVGLTSFAIVLVYWMWSAARRREVGFKALFPWFSPAAVQAVCRDFVEHIGALRRLRLSEVGHRPFPIAVHGLGLASVTVMGVTGTLSLLGAVPAGIREAGLSVHGAFANLVWAYLIGHASLAVLHEQAGHRLFRRMFSLRP